MHIDNQQFDDILSRLFIASMPVSYFTITFMILRTYKNLFKKIKANIPEKNVPPNNPLENKKPLKVKAVKSFNLFLVPTKGIEPSHPCEWQILSLLRLPIPPHGQFFRFKSSILKSSTLKPSNLQDLWNSWNLWNLRNLRNLRNL